MFEWIEDNWAGMCICFFIITTVWSEILSFTKSDNNSIAQLVISILKKLAGKE